MIEPTTVPATALPVLEPPKRKPNRLMLEADTAVGPRERMPRNAGRVIYDVARRLLRATIFPSRALGCGAIISPSKSP